MPGIPRKLLLTLVLVLLSLSPSSAADGPIRVGFVIDGPWFGNEPTLQANIAEIVALTEGEFETEFPPQARLVGDWTLETAARHLQTLLSDPEVDLVITWGMLASHTVCCLDELPKPVVAPVVIDQDLQGFPLENGSSGVPNLSYVRLPSGLASELAYFQSMIPFRRVAILSNAPLMDAIPELSSRMRQQLGELEMEFEFVPVRQSVDAALEAISDDTEAVYVWPLFHLPAAELQRLVDGLNERRLPTFSAFGGTEIDMGMLASLGSPEFLPRLARRVALNVQRILLGEAAGSLAVDFLMPERLRVNMKTARRIGVSPSWRLLLEADVLHRDELEGVETRSLRDAVSEAVRLNLDLIARQRSLAAGEQEVERSRSVLLPQIDLGALGVQIDDDRAGASLGSRAERELSASATLSQLLFSDRALAGVSIQSRLQEGREASYEALRLDIALEAATAYLNLLRVKSLVEVLRNNLELTRSNLELAQIRRSVGAANPSEVYRWESRIATDRKALIEVLGDQQVLEIQLNRLMHRPLGDHFLTREVGITDPGLLTGHDRFRGYTETPRRYETFTDAVVQAGLAASPEMREIDAAIAAQQRFVLSARRAYWAPTIGLEASFEEILDRSGAGSSPPEFDLFPLPMVDDRNWSVGVSATLPLFRGGDRAAERLQAEFEFERLQLERAAVEEKVEQRVRSAMAETWSTFPGIELTRQAADAAGKNLDLVSDAYARGAVPIIDLLDAQNAALNADAQATNAIYDFLIALMQVERASGHFHLLLTPEETADWFDRIDQVFASRGIDVAEPGLPADISRTQDD